MLYKKCLQVLTLILTGVLLFSACVNDPSNNENSISESLSETTSSLQEVENNNETPVPESLQETTSSLQEVELVLSEAVELTELTPVLEKLSASLDLLASSIAESANLENEVLETLSQNIKEFSDTNSELVKVTRELAYVNFVDSLRECLDDFIGVFQEGEPYIAGYEQRTDLIFSVCFGATMDNSLSQEMMDLFTFHGTYGRIDGPVFRHQVGDFFHSEKMTDFFLEEISRAHP